MAGLAIGMGTALHRNFLSERKRVTQTHYLMGTIVNFNILALDEAMGRHALRRTVAEMKRLISIFDHRQAGTALRKLNQAGGLHDAPAELIQIVNHSVGLGTLTNGAFDITVLPIVEAFRAGAEKVTHLAELVDYRNILLNGDQIQFARPGMSITLDGIAKGRVVDGGIHVLKSLGFDNVLVEAGGDVMAASSEVDGKDWKIAVSHPRPAIGKEFIASFSVKNRAVTTSGDYLNTFTADLARHHIIDPRTCASPTELSSATVIAPSAAEADALSTVLMVLGLSQGLDFINRIPDAEALLVTRDLAVHKTEGFPMG